MKVQFGRFDAENPHFVLRLGRAMHCRALGIQGMQQLASSGGAGAGGGQTTGLRLVLLGFTESSPAKRLCCFLDRGPLPADHRVVTVYRNGFTVPCSWKTVLDKFGLQDLVSLSSSIRLAMDPSDLCLIHSTRSSWTGECTKCCFSACEARAVSSSVRKDLADFPCSHWQHSVECMILNGYQ